MNKPVSLDRVKEQFLALLPEAETVTQESLEEGENHDQDKPEQKKTANKGVSALLPILLGDPLYISRDDGTSYIQRKGRLLQLDSRNRQLCEDLRLDGYEQNGKAPSRETVSTVIALLSAQARRTGTRIELFNRTGCLNDAIYYDMGTGKAVEIRPGSWSLVKSPVMFREFSHQRPQVMPSRKGGDPLKLLDFFLLNQEQQLLFIVTVISCLIPRISHPAMHISGSQGSGKSFATKLIKSIIDPSGVLLSVMPRKPEDLDLLIYRHKALVLDNLSALNSDTCDRLCSLISGGIIEKRTLHTDLETTILKANPVILYSSIGSLHSRPDLTERTIVFELQRIPAQKRLEESVMLERFEAALPSILGGMFDVLGKAMKLYSSCELSGVPRMAEFAKWGYVIAEALTGKGEQFIDDYANNSSMQVGELIERDTLLAAIAEAMDDHGELSGTFNEVLLILKKYAAPGESASGYRSLMKDKTFPSARGFRKHIERIRIPLEDMGIQFRIDNRRTSRGKASVFICKTEEKPKGHTIKA